MKWVDYACAWAVFAVGVVGLMITEIRHPPQAVLDTPLLWIFLAMFNLLRIRNGYSVANLKVFCLGANLATFTLEVVRLKLFGFLGLGGIIAFLILVETVFSLIPASVGTTSENPTAANDVKARPSPSSVERTAPKSLPLMYDSRMRTLLQARAIAPLLHVFLFGLSWLPIYIHPLVPQPSFWVFPLGVADFPISLLAGIALFHSDAWTPYALAGWLVFGTIWWFFLGWLIEVKVSLNRRR